MATRNRNHGVEEKVENILDDLIDNSPTIDHIEFHRAHRIGKGK